jgi:hypothetical protein
VPADSGSRDAAAAPAATSPASGERDSGNGWVSAAAGRAPLANDGTNSIGERGPSGSLTSSPPIASASAFSGAGTNSILRP